MRFLDMRQLDMRQLDIRGESEVNLQLITNN